MPERPARLILLAQQADAGLEQLCERAGVWGGDRFQVELCSSDTADALTGLVEADALLALDAASASYCSAHGLNHVDFTAFVRHDWPQQLVRQMRSMPGTGLHRQFSADKDVRIQERVPIHRGFVQLERIDFQHRLHTGGWSPLLQRETLHRCPAVGVLPYDPRRDEVLLIEQIRIAAIEDRNGPWLLELIAGLVEPGELPHEVCVRESMEEAGVQIGAPQLIADYLPSTGISDEQMLVYVAPFEAGTAGGIHGLIEEGEDIRVLTMSCSEAFELLDCGRISNAATIIALQWLMLNAGQLRKDWSAD